MPHRYTAPLLTEAPKFLGSPGSTQKLETITLLCAEDIPIGVIGAYSSDETDQRLYVARDGAGLDTFDFAGVVMPYANTNAINQVNDDGRRFIPAGNLAVVAYRGPSIWVPVQQPIENFIRGFEASVQLSSNPGFTPGIITTGSGGSVRRVQGAFMLSLSENQEQIELRLNMSLNDV